MEIYRECTARLVEQLLRGSRGRDVAAGDGAGADDPEAERLARLLAIPAGAEVLDVPCGGGRIALALGERGYRMTGVDWSSEFLSHALAADAASEVTWERRDMRDLPWRARFDGAVCVGNSFGYLDDTGNAEFLQAVRAALKPGARFVLETPMVLENLSWGTFSSVPGGRSVTSICSSKTATIRRAAGWRSSTPSSRMVTSTSDAVHIAPTHTASSSS